MFIRPVILAFARWPRLRKPRRDVTKLLDPGFKLPLTVISFLHRYRFATVWGWISMPLTWHKSQSLTIGHTFPRAAEPSHPHSVGGDQA